MKYPVFWIMVGNVFAWIALLVSIWAIFFKHPEPEPSFRYKVEPSFSVEHKPSFSF